MVLTFCAELGCLTRSISAPSRSLLRGWRIFLASVDSTSQLLSRLADSIKLQAMLLRLLLRRWITRGPKLYQHKRAPAEAEMDLDEEISAQTGADIREIKYLHSELRSATKVGDFHRKLQENAEKVKNLGVQIVYETFMEGFLGWSFDSSLIPTLNFMKKHTRTKEEQLWRLNTLIEMSRYSQVLGRRRDPRQPKSIELDKYLNLEIVDIMGSVKRSEHTLSPMQLMICIYANAHVNNPRLRPVWLLNQYFAKEEPKIVPRYFFKFLKGYTAYGWFTRAQFPALEDFLINKLGNQINSFPSKFDIEMLNKLAQLSSHHHSSLLKTSSGLQKITTRICYQFQDHQSKHLIVAFKAFRLLPEDFSNTLLNTAMKNLLITLKEHKTIFLVTALTYIQPNRIDKMLLQQTKFEVLNRFRSCSWMELLESLRFLSSDSEVWRDPAFLDFYEKQLQQSADKKGDMPLDALSNLTVILDAAGRDVSKYLPSIAHFSPKQEPKQHRAEDDWSFMVNTTILKVTEFTQLLEKYNTNGQFDKNISFLLDFIKQFIQTGMFYHQTYVPRKLKKGSKLIQPIYTDILHRITKQWEQLINSKKVKVFRDIVELFYGPETTKYFEQPLLDLVKNLPSAKADKRVVILQSFCRSAYERKEPQVLFVLKVILQQFSKILLSPFHINLIWWTIWFIPKSVILESLEVKKYLVNLLQVLSKREQKVLPTLFATCFEHLWLVNIRPQWMIDNMMKIITLKPADNQRFQVLSIDRFIRIFNILIPYFSQTKRIKHIYVPDEESQLTEGFQEFIPEQKIVPSKQIAEVNTKELERLLSSVMLRLKEEMTLKENSPRTISQCLFNFVQLSPLAGIENRALVKQVTETLVQYTTENKTPNETKESIYVMLCLLWLETKEYIVLDDIAREQILLRFQEFSERKGEIQLFGPWIEHYARLWTKDDSKKILPKFQQWLELTSKLNDEHLPFDLLIDLYKFSIVHKSVALKSFTAHSFRRTLTPFETIRLLRIFNARRDTSKIILDSIIKNYNSNPESFPNYAKFQILFALALARYTPKEDQMGLINKIVKDLEQNLTASSDFFTKEGQKHLQGFLLNYMWVVLTLQLDYSKLTVFSKAIELFVEHSIKYVDTIRIEYLKGLIADVFLLLKEKNMLPKEFVRDMLERKSLWMRQNTIQNRTIEALLKGRKFEHNAEIIEGLIVDYYLPQSNTVLVTLPSFMMDYTYDNERGYSRARDLILKGSKVDPKVIKINVAHMNNSPTLYLKKLFK